MTDYERLCRAESEIDCQRVEIAKLKCEIDTLRDIILRLKDKLYAHCDEYTERDIEMMFGSSYERDIDEQVEEMFYNDESEGRAGLTD